MTNVIMLMVAGHQNRLPDQRVKRIGDDSFERQKPGTMGPAPTKGADWAIAMTLIQTAKLNGVEPMAYLTDVLKQIVSGRTKASAGGAAAVELDGSARVRRHGTGSIANVSR